jgi:peptidoglycan/LPS O-acetylase OafA/YrhL
MTVLLDWSTGGQVTTETYQFQTTGPFVALANVFMLQTFLVKPLGFNIALWSLAVEAFFYATAPSLRRQSDSVLLALITLSAMIYLAPKQEQLFLYQTLTGLRALIYAWPWCVGFYIFKNRDIGTFLIFTILGTVLVMFNHHDNNPQSEPLAPLTYVLTMAGLFAASRFESMPRWPMARSALFTLGDLSYPIYLLQFPVFIFAFYYLGLRNDLMLFVACLIVSALALYFIEYGFKRTCFPRHHIVAAERDNGRYFHRQTPLTRLRPSPGPSKDGRTDHDDAKATA